MAIAVPGRRAVVLQHRGAGELGLDLELDPELKMDGETCRQSSWGSVAVSAVFVRCRSRAAGADTHGMQYTLCHWMWW